MSFKCKGCLRCPGQGIKPIQLNPGYRIFEALRQARVADGTPTHGSNLLNHNYCPSCASFITAAIEAENQRWAQEKAEREAERESKLREEADHRYRALDLSALDSWESALPLSPQTNFRNTYLSSRP